MLTPELSSICSPALGNSKSRPWANDSATLPYCLPLKKRPSDICNTLCTGQCWNIMAIGCNPSHQAKYQKLSKRHQGLLAVRRSQLHLLLSFIGSPTGQYVHRKKPRACSYVINKQQSIRSTWSRMAAAHELCQQNHLFASLHKFIWKFLSHQENLSSARSSFMLAPQCSLGTTTASQPNG